MTALFEDVIFGPIHSRRLGLSLGVNLLPRHAKICNFDCIYCECGSNAEREGDSAERRFADRESVVKHLRTKLLQMAQEGQLPDVITFAGNGEPTLHPEFERIISETIAIRDELSPESKISVLSNATRIDREDVGRALRRVDNNILKLDSAREATARRMNRPVPSYRVAEVIENIAHFDGGAIVQTMFLRGEVAGERVDNTTDEEVEAWLEALRRIKPRSVMIYSIDRDTPCKGLEKLSREELSAIAARVRGIGLECSVA